MLGSIKDVFIVLFLGAFLFAVHPILPVAFILIMLVNKSARYQEWVAREQETTDKDKSKRIVTRHRFSRF
ncbi:MAG TPA: hypothetical protein VHK27_04965 [Gammaproteobacteria bacterium]|nr:hypothetical protein [Gammaproteobacteria bacterium]